MSDTSDDTAHLYLQREHWTIDHEMASDEMAHLTDFVSVRSETVFEDPDLPEVLALVALAKHAHREGVDREAVAQADSLQAAADDLGIHVPPADILPFVEWGGDGDAPEPAQATAESAAEYTGDASAESAGGEMNE